MEKVKELRGGYRSSAFKHIYIYIANPTVLLLHSAVIYIYIIYEKGK